MQKGKPFWYMIAITSAVSLLLLGTGAALAVKDSMQTAPQPAMQPQTAAHPDAAQKPTAAAPQTSEAPNGGSIKPSMPANVQGDYRLVALGDSLTRGTGDPSGQGYVGYLTDGLQKKANKKVITSNLGINGMKAPELLQYVQSPDVQKEIKNAHLIALSIGGNDLTQGLGSVNAPDPAVAAATMQTYLDTLDKILKQIRGINQQAPILFVGLYNPFPFTGDTQQKALQVLDEWNSKTAKLFHNYPNTLLVPTQDIFTWNADKLLAQDHFHPNAEGYKSIATRMLQNLY